MPETPQDCNLPRVTRPVPLPGRAGVVTPDSPLRPLPPGPDLFAAAAHPPVAAAVPPTPTAPTTPPKLRRSLFGLAPAAAQRLLSEQAQELQARVQAARAEVQAEQARQEELADEVRRTRTRLEALHTDIDMLRTAVAQAQEREPVAAEVAARHLAARRQAQETRLQDLRFEAIRLEAELQRRESQILAVAAELYRIASSSGQLPAGLAVHMPLPRQEAAPAPEPAPAAPAEPGPQAAMAPPDRNRILVGKRLRRPLVTRDGRVIGASGDAISDAMIAAAEEHGLVAEMIGGLALPDEA